MESNELIGKVVTSCLREWLKDDSDEMGTARFMLDNLGDPQMLAVAKEVLADPFLSEKIDVKLPASRLSGSGLPDEALTDKRTTHFRNANIKKQAILVACTGDDERLSLKEMTAIGEEQLRAQPELWVAVANSDLGLPEEQCIWWEQALRGLQDVRVLALERYATFIATIHNAIKDEGEPMLSAIGVALPTLRIPRDKAYFSSSLNSKTARHKHRWRGLFNKLINRRAPYMLKQKPNQSPISQEELEDALDKVRSEIPAPVLSLVEQFIGADSGWTEEAAQLCECEWSNFEGLFTGLKKQKYNLGEKTQQFFEERYPEDLTEDDQEFIERISKVRPKSSDEESEAFYDRHKERLSEDKSLRGQWDKFVFGAPKECNDFLVGLLECFEYLFSGQGEATEYVLRIRCKSKTQHQLFQLNYKAVLYFSTAYRAVYDLSPSNIQWEVGELFNYPTLYEKWTEEKRKKTYSKSKAATQIQFYIEGEVNKDPIQPVQLVWKFPIDSVVSEYTSDLDRLEKWPCMAGLASVDSVSSKGALQTVDLRDTGTLHASYAQNRGSFIPAYDPNEDYGLQFLSGLTECVKKNMVSEKQAAVLESNWKLFADLYNKVLSEVSKAGYSEATSKLAKSYGSIIECINQGIEGKLAKVALLRPLLSIGTAKVDNGSDATIILPWHPLRLLSRYFRLHQFIQLWRDLLAPAPVTFGDGKLYLREFAKCMQDTYYPEVALAWEGDAAVLLSQTDSFLDYSLHERPICERGREDGINDNPTSAANLVLEMVKRYLALYPHERNNLSTVLYNCDSARLPQAVVAKLADLGQDDNDLRCEVVLRHRDGGRLSALYEGIVEQTDDDIDGVASSEVATDFLARLRIAIMAEQAQAPKSEEGRPKDIVFLDEVISRHAALDWRIVPCQNFQGKELRPPEWARKETAYSDDLESAAYLTCPNQLAEGWHYLRAISSLFRNEWASSLDQHEALIPARVLDFSSPETKSIFDEIHRLGNWVVNYDDLLDRRQIRNQDVRVIRYKQLSNEGRNILTSSTAPLGLLKSMLRERLESLSLGLEAEDIAAATERLIRDANALSGDLALRAAKRGESASELIGTVLSQYIVEQELKESSGSSWNNIPCGWFYLDEYAEWLGQRESQIADIMAIHLHDDNGVPKIGITITEVKYIGHESLAAKRKESQKQLRDTVHRLHRALLHHPPCYDRPLWISRICNMLRSSIQLPRGSDISLERWIRALMDYQCDIYIKGYSHVFVPSQDCPECSEIVAIADIEDGVQEIYGRPDLKKIVQHYIGNASPTGIRQDVAAGMPVIHKTYHPLSEANTEEQSANTTSSTNAEANEANVKSSVPESATKPVDENVDIIASQEVISSDKDATQITPASVLDLLVDEAELQHDDSAEAAWLKETVHECRTALQHFQLKSKIVEQKLTPNCALLKFEGSANLTVDQVIKRRTEFLTSYGIEIVSVRPEPGVVSIAVARPAREVVQLGTAWKAWDLESKTANCKLPIGVQEEDGELLYISPLDNAPHTLIAGSTNSGKSVLMQNLLMGIACSNHPENSRIYLIDPKGGVDYFAFMGLPHIEGDIIFDMEGAVKVLKQLVGEMERRYKVLYANRSPNIATLNAKEDASEHLPYIWVVHDEFAEWMLQEEYRDAVTSLVGRLGVKARAAGIFLVFAAQRPDKDVMPMQLRSQLGNRLILKVDSAGTSKIALGEEGAESLLGRGHMAAKIEGASNLIYAQVPYVSPETIEKVVQQLSAEYGD